MIGAKIYVCCVLILKNRCHYAFILIPVQAVTEKCTPLCWAGNDQGLAHEAVKPPFLKMSRLHPHQPVPASVKVKLDLTLEWP